MNEERTERALKLRVGIFVVISVVAFLAVIYLLGARARLFESRYTIHAEFTEVGGLSAGATVRLAGVQIGRVSGVHLPSQPGGKVRVDMTLGKQFADRIRKDSVARIETQGLLGDRIIEITVGTPNAPPATPGEVIASRDPTDIGQIIGQGVETVRNVTALTESLRGTAEQLKESQLIEEAAGTVKAARALTEQIGRDITTTTASARDVATRLARIVDRVEKGPGLAHALLYEEPIALQRVNELIAKTDALIGRVERGEGAVGVLTSEQSSAAAKRLVAAMDRFGRMTEQGKGEEGLLPALLFDPRYKTMLEDLQVVARNFREVSDRLAGGRGTLGSLVRDEPGNGGIEQASRDLQAAMANLKEITDKINEGEGTIGALIADPTIYERLSAILDGAGRSRLLRGLIRGLGRDRNEDPAK